LHVCVCHLLISSASNPSPLRPSFGLYGEHPVHQPAQRAFVRLCVELEFNFTERVQHLLADLRSLCLELDFPFILYHDHSIECSLSAHRAPRRSPLLQTSRSVNRMFASSRSVHCANETNTSTRPLSAAHAHVPRIPRTPRIPRPRIRSFRVRVSSVRIRVRVSVGVRRERRNIDRHQIYFQRRGARAPVLLHPPQHIRVAPLCSDDARLLVPRAAVFPRPFQHLQVSARCRSLACLLVPRAAVLPRPLQHLQVPAISGP